MKKIIMALSLLLCLGVLAACGNGGGDVTVTDEQGNTHKVTKISFWGWGDDTETLVFSNLIDQYNKTNEDYIEVEYIQKPSDGYTSSMEQILSGSKAPDLFYVGDGDLKKWVELGFLKDITSMVNESEDIDLDDMWSNAISRYRYNTATKTSLATDPLYCLPKDIGPTVIYYNVDAFKSVGVNVISKDIEDCTPSEARGYNPETKTFNNRIAMTWEESEALSKLLTKSYNSASPTDYGYYTEWWFNYVWSVGGDVLSRNPETNNFEFALGNTAPNYNKDGVQLPSNREAFNYFVSLSNELGISPKPSTLSQMGKTNYFTSQKTAMYVDGRWSVVNLRKLCKFEWDVAPLPVHKDGELAGHSGSMGFGIWSRSKKAEAAYKVMEYLAGPIGQAAQAETGFNIPNQKSIAYSDVFLQPDQYPKNARAFIDAVEYQKPGDWAMLADGAWIDEWAPTLNGSVLNGNLTLDKFFDQVTTKTNNILKKYTE